MSDSIRYLLVKSQEIVSQLTEGELTPEMEAALTQIDMKLPAAVDSAAEMIERMGHEAEYFAARAEIFQGIAKRCLAAKERVREAIKQGMLIHGLTELPGNDVRMVLSRTKPAVVVDAELLDPGYLTTKTTVVPDKTRIREDLDIGLNVQGATKVESFSLRTYPNARGAK